MQFAGNEPYQSASIALAAFLSEQNQVPVQVGSGQQEVTAIHTIYISEFRRKKIGFYRIVEEC